MTKGAPHVVLDLCANKDEIGTAVHVVVEDLAARGIRSLAVAVTDTAGDWRMAGMLTFLDPPRPDTKVTGRVEFSRRRGSGQASRPACHHEGLHDAAWCSPVDRHLGERALVRRVSECPRSCRRPFGRRWSSGWTSR